jgi:hypothetical protein
MRQVAALVFAAAALAAVAAGCGGGNGTSSGLTTNAGGNKECGAGYVQAKLPWGVKCLVYGEDCKRGRDKAYRHYGFECDAEGRLRHAGG